MMIAGYDFRRLNISEESSAEMDQLISSATFDDRTLVFELRESQTILLAGSRLNVRKLHDLGLTGKCSIGIIDDGGSIM